MAQSGQDEMIEADGVFRTAERLKQTTFTLKWYPNSGHVITVGPERRQFEQDVADFWQVLAGVKIMERQTIKREILAGLKAANKKAFLWKSWQKF